MNTRNRIRLEQMRRDERARRTARIKLAAIYLSLSTAAVLLWLAVRS